LNGDISPQWDFLKDSPVVVKPMEHPSHVGEARFGTLVGTRKVSR
jgi:hypothetical protein